MLTGLYEKYKTSAGVFTDTRKIIKNGIFFALKGPNFDANKLAHEALIMGAKMCVVDDPSVVKGDKYILVSDVLKTLQDLAKYHRKQLKIPVIGLTGSNGKTTSKELLACVLNKKFNVFATEGNLNNHIGVPLSILSIQPSHEVAIIEMGANHVGEIAFLSDICQPSHGFITNIGKAHLEGFGGIEGVIRGKSELYHFLIQTEGIVWINSDNHILSNMAKRFKNPLFYPKKGDFYHCELIEANPIIKLKAENGEHLTTQLIGRYNFENIAAALCIGKSFKVPDNLANKAITEYVPDNNRSQIITRGSNTIILDAYNANPTSMLKAIENLRLIDSTDKIAILGDMNELGEDSKVEHELIVDAALESNFKEVIFCGSKMKPKTDTKVYKHFENRIDLIDYLKDKEIKNTTVLIKASRSLGLENILDSL